MILFWPWPSWPGSGSGSIRGRGSWSGSGSTSRSVAALFHPPRESVAAIERRRRDAAGRGAGGPGSIASSCGHSATCATCAATTRPRPPKRDWQLNVAGRQVNVAGVGQVQRDSRPLAPRGCSTADGCDQPRVARKAGGKERAGHRGQRLGVGTPGGGFKRRNPVPLSAHGLASISARSTSFGPLEDLSRTSEGWAGAVLGANLYGAYSNSQTPGRGGFPVISCSLYRAIGS
jgi:hypothetical protein